MVCSTRIAGIFLLVLVLTAWAMPTCAVEDQSDGYREEVERAIAESLAKTPREHGNASATLVRALLLSDRENEAAEALRSFRSTGATEGDVQALFCHLGPLLNSKYGDTATVNDRLRALDPDVALLVQDGRVHQPEILEHPKPEYTQQAREARLQGTVILQAVVSTDGRVVGDAEVLKGLPMGLSEKAVAVVKQWTFKPATLNGAPVSACYVLVVNFQL